MAIRVPPGGSSLGSFLSTTSALALGGPRSQIVNGWAPDAALDIDFTTGTLDSRITFARGSTATYYNSSGIIASAASGAPRFDYDPATLTARGLLLEEQRTNNVLQSETFDDAYWNKASVSVTANSTIAPDGATTADLMTSTATGGDTLNYGSTSLANNTWTWSIYVKRGTVDWFYLRPQGAEGITYAWFNLATGTVGTVQAGNTAAIQPVGGGWYRLTVTRVLTPTYFVYGISNADNSTVASLGLTAYVWGAQFEAGAFATSYIPTTSAAVTRSADTAEMTGTNFSSWWNASAGTFVAEYRPQSISSTQPIISVNDTTANEAIRLYGSGADPKAIVVDGGTTQADLDAGTIAANANFYKFGLAFTLNDFAACLDGGTVATDVAGTLPTVTQLQFHTDIAGNVANLHIKRLQFFNTRKTDAELQALTAPVAVGTSALVAQAAVAASTTGVSGSTSTGLDSVVFLSGFEGVNGSTTIIEEAKGKAVTAFGSAQIDTAQSKFGGSSLLLNSATSDYLSLADHADWAIGANQFTIEAWIRISDTVNSKTIIGQANASNARSFYFYVNGAQLVLAVSSNGTTVTSISSTGFSAAINTWYHVAADRDATNKVRIYVDGVMRGSATFATSLFNSPGSLMIGRLEYTAPSFDYNGWIDELRFTNGIARYASDAGFTVPGAAFTRALTPQPATMIGAGTSSSAITDTTLNVGSAVVASTTGVSRSIAPSVALTAQAAAAASTTGLSRSIATPVALAAQQSAISGLGGTGTILVGTGVITTRPALVAGAGLTASAGVGALQVSVTTIDAHGVSAWIATAANLNADLADIDGLGEIPINTVVSGPYAQVGDLWEGAAVWGKIAGKWRRLRLWTKAADAWGVAAWDQATQEVDVWSLPAYGELDARGAHVAGSGFIRDQIWGAGDLVAGPALVTDSSSLSGLNVITNAAWEATPLWVKANGKWRRATMWTNVSEEWKRVA